VLSQLNNTVSLNLSIKYQNDNAKFKLLGKGQEADPHLKLMALIGNFDF
jgi:hypothetical protein